MPQLAAPSAFCLRGNGPRPPLPVACPKQLPLSAARAGRLSPPSRSSAGVCSPSPLLVYDDTLSGPSARGNNFRGHPAASALPPSHRPRLRSRLMASAPQPSAASHPCGRPRGALVSAAVLRLHPRRRTSGRARFCLPPSPPAFRCPLAIAIPVPAVPSISFLQPQGLVRKIVRNSGAHGDAKRSPRIFVTAVVRRRRLGRGGRSVLCIVYIV